VRCSLVISAHFLISQSSRSSGMDSNPLVLYLLANVRFQVLQRLIVPHERFDSILPRLASIGRCPRSRRQSPESAGSL
jgi:hypothetical protein